MSKTPTEYERATAILVHASIKLSIEKAYPELPMGDQDALYIGIVDRLARMRGCAVRREFICTDEGDE